MGDFNRIKSSHTEDQDLAAVNPNYSTGKKEWTENCQRCVAAYEARRRGYDVEALPHILNGTDNLVHTYSANGWPSIFKADAGDLVSCASNSGSGSMKKVQEQMAAFGDGSRAIVKVVWRGSGRYGHVFIAEQRNGKTHFIDPQSNNKNVERNFSPGSIKPGKTQLLRIDNREFGDNIKLCCKNKGS